MIDPPQHGSNVSMAVSAGFAVLLLAGGMGLSHLFGQSSLAADARVDPTCSEDCSVQVVNSFEDTDIEVYLCPTKASDYIGDVSALKSKTFDLPDGEREHVQLHIRESPTQEFINLRCARQFDDGKARAVIEPDQPLERCEGF